MSAVLLAAIGLIAFLLGYLVYSKFIATKIYQLDPDFATALLPFDLRVLI